MPADVFIDTRDSRSNPIDDAIGQAKGAYRAGVKRVWFGQYFDLDAIALAAIVGSQVPGLEVGTAAVPIGATEFILMPLDAEAARLHRLWTLAATL